ncbi:hypothetical protein [Nonomuraea longicatena]|uniref:hypothetical protein n=1 Tax=Nonomuraea longicatena TaxID=83682 RepID=UPI0031D5FB69
MTERSPGEGEGVGIVDEVGIPIGGGQRATTSEPAGMACPAISTPRRGRTQQRRVQNGQPAQQLLDGGLGRGRVVADQGELVEVPQRRTAIFFSTGSTTFSHGASENPLADHRDHR